MSSMITEPPLPTTQPLICKLKLLLDDSQRKVVAETATAYRSALNHVSAVAFAHGKMSQN